MGNQRFRASPAMPVLIVLVALGCAPRVLSKAAVPAVARPVAAVAAGPGYRVPIDVANNHVYVRVAAGDRTFDFILDTGAASSSFDLGIARQLGLGFGQEFRAGGAGAGTIAGAQLNGASVQIVGTSITQRVPSALDLSRLPRREAHRMDGILGADFIGRWVMAIDYVGRELRLYDRDTFAYHGTGRAVPISFASGHPIIDGEVALASGETVRGRFVVDVGASLALALTKPFVETHRLRDRISPTVRRRGGGGVGGLTTSDLGRLPAFRLGGAEVRNVVVQLFGDSAGVFSGNPDWIGNVGGDILRRFTVFLDYGRQRIILEPHASTDEPFEIDMSGVAFAASEDFTTVLVDAVLPSSPAAEAGLVAGDTLIAVDGRPATTRTITELRVRFRRAGDTTELTVRRGGEPRTVRLTTRRVL